MSKKKKGKRHPRRETVFPLREAKKEFMLRVTKPPKSDLYHVEVTDPDGFSNGRYCVYRQALEGGAEKKENGYVFSIKEVPVSGNENSERRIEVILPSSWFKGLFKK